ncbi:hypothetical protein RHGRI_005117 [Rhododendron griersonianum]|uniref:Uncharacterized protein n=1 Tax=Rhododendron griersonianum TaxID=479676 RepID=A0AAV6LCA5_9ERIC|nr:hypothetical protein RHGRI_005117 [Rhododendron griersonianum]
MTYSRRMFPAAMNATNSPSSTLRYANEPPAKRWNLNSEFSITKDGKHGGDSRYDVGQDDGRARVLSGLESGENEDSGANNRTHAEPHQVPPTQRLLHLVPPTQRLLHLVVTPGLHLQLGRVQRPGRDSVHEPRRSLPQRCRVVAPALERFLGEEIAFGA